MFLYRIRKYAYIRIFPQHTWCTGWKYELWLLFIVKSLKCTVMSIKYVMTIERTVTEWNSVLVPASNLGICMICLNANIFGNWRFVRVNHENGNCPVADSVSKPSLKSMSVDAYGQYAS